MRTFSDMVAQLSDSFIIQSNKDRVERLSYIAVRSCYQDFGSRANWNYLRRPYQINTTGFQETGTIGYVAATKTLTLTGATWPSWILNGEFLINRNIYRVQTVVDSTHVILDSNQSPVIDIDSGTAYVLVQSEYPLPTDFIQLRGITEIERLWNLAWISPEELLARQQIWYYPTNSIFYTIMGGKNGNLIIKFNPPPSFARTLNIIYQAAPRTPLLLKPFTNGTCAATSTQNTVTITSSSGGPTVPTSLTGCVFRLGSTIVPEGPFTDNPPVEEHVIASVSGNTLTLQDAMQSSPTAARFSIDDPIDIHLLSGQSYFDRMCEARLLRLHMADSRKVADAEAAENRARLDAMAQDSLLNPNSVSASVRATGMNEQLLGMVSVGVVPPAM